MLIECATETYLSRAKRPRSAAAQGKMKTRRAHTGRKAVPAPAHKKKSPAGERESVKILLADDHDVVRGGIMNILQKEEDIVVLGAAVGGSQLLEMDARTPADVYLLDLSMPNGLSGIETMDKLLERDPENKVVILTNWKQSGFVRQAMRHGAMGYVVKDDVDRDLPKAIREAHAGRCFFSPEIPEKVVAKCLAERRNPQKKDRGCDLTSREMQALHLILEKHSSDKDLARELGLALDVAHWCRREIMRKLDVHKSVDLRARAVEEGLIDPNFDPWGCPPPDDAGE